MRQGSGEGPPAGSLVGPPVSRRRLLRAACYGLIAATLAACARAVGSPSPGPEPTPSTPGTSPAPTLVTAPSAPPATAAAPPTLTPALTLREKVARMLVVGFRGMTVGDAPWVAEAIRDRQLGGVILFDRDGKTQGPRNVESPAQVRRLVADLRALAPDREVIVAIDQEGGLVTRLSPRYGYPELQSEEAIGEDGDAAVQRWADGLVETLADAGINLNFAPVVDVDVNPDNPAIGALHRSFSADPAVVSRDAEIETQAHRARNIRTALKHFPGLGSATANTDYGVADVTDTWTRKELDPYRDLLAKGLVDMIMAAHVINGQLDPHAPASLSSATITGLLRGDLGWNGVVVTDDLEAGAITDAFGANEAVRLAIQAGCDLLLFANQQGYQPGRVEEVLDFVEGLVRDGTITEPRIDASVARLERLFPSNPATGG